MRASESPARSVGTEIILSPELRTSSVIAALVVSPTGEILAVNDCMARLIGRPTSEILGKNAQTSLFAGASDWQPWEVARDRQVSGAEIQIRSADGRTLFLRGDIRLVAERNGRRWLSGTFIDATPARHLETSLTHAARMEAVASLTSGIAHDFNNLLTVLVGNLYLISEGVREQGALYEKTKLARDAAKRGADLIKQLLAFARNECIESPTLDPAKVIRKIEPLLKRALGSRITLETRIGSDVGLVDVSAAQLESAIVNLVINARDAIESAGTIQIAVANATADETEAATYGVRPGEYVRVSVTDTGVGIPKELLGRVFEPFFTTKASGKGTGLGLSMVRLFALREKGTVLLDSRPGNGTTVSILLPRSVATTAATTVSTMPLSTLPGGKETILVFAEDDDVRSTIEQILKVLGYRVILRSEWREALTLARSSTVQLALIDIKSGSDASGLKLLQAVAKLTAPVKTLILRDSTSVPQAGVTTLQKPFDLPGLATTVRRVLDGSRHHAR